MSELSEIISAANIRMAAIESSRDEAIAMSRIVIRKTKNVIHAIHTGADYMKTQGELKQDVRMMLSKVKNEPEVLYSGIVGDACAEYAEAMIVSAIVKKKPLPSFDTLKITPGSWMLGLADSVGELRRLVLTNLMNDNLQKAEYYFKNMEEISGEVMKFDIPDAIIPIRRKQDVARGVMEKTRSDIANAIMLSKFKQN